MSRASGRRKAIDWVEARRLLARSAEATEEALRPSPACERALLAERARALARIPPEPEAPGERLDALAFRLAGERYALETRFVREVAPAPEVLPVPGAPPHLAGIASLRGDVLPVLDLGRALDPAGAATTEEGGWFVVLGELVPELAFLADEVDRVATLRLSLLSPPSPSAAAASKGWARGVTDDLLTLLDGGTILSDPSPFGPFDE